MRQSAVVCEGRTRVSKGPGMPYWVHDDECNQGHVQQLPYQIEIERSRSFRPAASVATLEAGPQRRKVKPGIV